MAYSALVLLTQTLDKILHPCPQISSLKEKVCYLLDFLEDSSENCTIAITDLEGQIRDAAYEAEDIIESHLAKEALPKSSTSFWEMLCSTIQNAIPAFRQREVLNHDLELEIKHLRKSVEEFEFILESFFKIKKGKMIELLPPVAESLSTGARLSRTTSCGQSATVGLNEDLLKIKDWLTGSSSSRDIISLVGMGGIGKTTLGRNLYEDALVDFHFDIRAWVTVSQDYHWQGVVKDLWNSIVLVKLESHDEVISIEESAEIVYKSLKGRRYLIVMDDVWDTKLWDYMKRLFPDDDNGSRIILTTRLSEVAFSSESFSYIHDMNLLGLEESWNLLSAKVFGEECCPSELEKIGMDIAKNCKGLPLALVTIGGVLSKRRTRDYWEYIAKNMKLGVTGNDDRLMEILSLSYNHLPHHLKACFLYMGVFPEDRDISISRLIKLWVAEGFLKPLYSKSLEEVAEDCLQDLVDRSLVMVGKRGHRGKIKTCIMHDILRDLCVKKAKEERFLLVLNRNARNLPEVGYSEYRVSIHSHILRVGMHESRVRSFLCFAENDSGNLSLSFARFRLLKVLDALTIKFHGFPIEMVELVNLRYLGLLISSHIFKLQLPAAIVKLKNLQTLILSKGVYDFNFGVWCLPSEIWEMPQLRHLSFKRGLLPHPSRERLDREYSFDMAHLQTLSGVQNFKCRKEVFQIMPHLKKLRISYVFGKRKRWSPKDFNSFVYLHSLETLTLSLDDSGHWKDLPLNFSFPSTLKKLTLSGGCRIPWSKMTMVGSLPSLEVLKLKKSAFEGRVWEPEEGEFLRLKYLLLDDIHLRHWKANETHFPNLRQLNVFFCFKLAEIPSAIGDITTLQILELRCCSDSLVKSAKLIEEEQRSLGNDSLKVSVKYRTF
ncbi:putative late blight resistance protein homolog R1A-10 [Primulina eburnea]|uniref:putative late blight resistance protein homolog R1A-10 n=1 Tax=Primulina eburnea TaxID=1245227 RepID=UPI003C6C4CE5